MGRLKKQGLELPPFAARMAQLRQQTGIRMETLSQQINVSKSYISLLESGERKPSREVVEKLALAFFPDGDESGLDELLILAGFAPVNLDSFSLHPDLVTHYEACLAENQQDFKTFTLLVIALIKTGKYEKATQKIQQGFQVFSESVYLQALLSQLELARGNFEAAAVAQEAAIESFRRTQPTPALAIGLADLLYNLGEIYFIRGYRALAKDKPSEAQTSFGKAKDLFEQALALAPQDIMILDELARVLFNLADLAPPETTQALWEQTRNHFQKVLASPYKYQLGVTPLKESGAFLAHAFTKSGQWEQAELLLSVLTACSPSYWLGHYLEACFFSLRYEKQNQDEWLDRALISLQRALDQKDGSSHSRYQAEFDPDLKNLRLYKQTAFENLIHKEN